MTEPAKDFASEVFVIRGGRMLALLRAGDYPLWYLPGGMAEPDEQPAATAVRETFEETQLTIEPHLLNVWRRRSFAGTDRIHASYVAWSDSGEVVLNEEHTAYEWIEPAAFVERHWRDLPGDAPEWLTSMRDGIVRNVDLLVERLTARKPMR